ncbi:MAG: preprotein translocase subunit SecA, partial [Thermoguttaceae bacterium]
MNLEDTSARVPQGTLAQLQAVGGGPTQRRLAQWALLLPKIDEFEKQYVEQSDAKLRKESLSLRYRAKSGEQPIRLLPEAYALVREAARRTINMRHFDVQVLGGIGLFLGIIAEMETGEGKTLTATLPLYLHALSGRGALLATVNDYLAARDAEWMGPVYKLLGLSVGVIETEMRQPERRKAYACDITYGTAKEFGFDFLRDRLLKRRIQQQMGGVLAAALGTSADVGEEPVQRAPHFALVDEADSVLIDDARTPLIISAIPGEGEQREAACYKWAAEAADQFVDDEHYEYDHEKKKIELTLEGRQLVRSLPKSEILNPVGLVDLYDYMERAIKVGREFQRDHHYVIRDDEVVIVDESTGRLAEGRKWRAGIHQAVEAREDIEVTVDSGQAARITVQDYFLRCKHLA